MNNFILFKKHAPRWIVLSIDLVISLVSIIFAYFLQNNLKVPSNDFLILVISFVIVIRFISFIASRTYAGIVRYTSTRDAIKIFVVVAIGSMFFLALNLIGYLSEKQIIIPSVVIVLDYLTTVFLMTASRLFYKALFYQVSNYAKPKIHVIIFGSDDSSLAAANTIEHDNDAKYEIVAFVDNEFNSTGKKLDGKPVYPIHKLTELLELKTISHLIIAKTNIPTKLKKEIIDICINYYVKVLYVPQASEWINGELSFSQLKKIKIEDLLERPPIVLNKKEISKDVNNKIVLVTGAAGSIGSEIVRQLTKFAPKKIIIFDQAESPLYDLELELREEQQFFNFEIIIGDMTDKNRTEKMFKIYKPNIVYHAAAYKHVPMMENNPSEAVRNNIWGSKLMADLSVEYGVGKFVMVSTDKAVNPTNVMGASKRIAEIYTQALNQLGETRFVTTRFGNVLGSNGSVIPRFKKQIEEGGPITVTHPEITRFFMTIPEACSLVLEAGAQGKGGEIFIFDMGKSVKIVDLAKKMIRLSGLKLGKDIHITFTGLRPGEKLYEELLADKENTMSTHHKQIMIAEVRQYKLSDAAKQIQELIDTVSQNNDFITVKKMKEVVPEFLSKNSIYEQIDKEMN